MTTVIDPSGAPVPVYNRSGATIVEVAATGLNQAGAAPITALSGHTIVLATPVQESEEGVLLPAAADVGDVVEVYSTSSGKVVVYPSPGDNLNEGPNSFKSVQRNIGGALFRKVTSTGWWSVGGF